MIVWRGRPRPRFRKDVASNVSLAIIRNAAGRDVTFTSPRKKGGSSPPSPAPTFNSGNSSEHLRAFYVDRIALHRAGRGDVMPFMPLERVRIVDHQDLLIFVGDNHHLCARSQAFFGAGLSSSIGALGPALVIGDPPVDRGALSH